ncbi:MAG: SsrA-binding protein [Flavobacteriaceae bacterium]|nr:MAG: SsrA-binding protein [Flavobacteriaceae bacterium]
MIKKLNIENRKAKFNFEFIQTLECGLVLTGTEVKSIRASNASIAESFCQIKNQELYLINMYIKEYELGTYANHQPRRERKLLIKAEELKKLHKAVKEKGLTLVPVRLYFNDKNKVKIKVALGKGKKIHDKRHVLKEKDLGRDLRRVVKNY